MIYKSKLGMYWTKIQTESFKCSTSNLSIGVSTTWFNFYLLVHPDWVLDNWKSVLGIIPQVRMRSLTKDFISVVCALYEPGGVFVLICGTFSQYSTGWILKGVSLGWGHIPSLCERNSREPCQKLLQLGTHIPPRPHWHYVTLFRISRHQFWSVCVSE